MSEDVVTKAKSFWQRKEGFTGTLFLIGGGILGLLTLNKVLPFFIGLFDNMINLVGKALTLGALGILGFIMVYILVNPRVHAIAWYAFQSIMRKITGLFVTIDPIGILKGYIKSLADKISDMEEQMEKLMGHIRNLKNVIATNKKEISNEMTLASKAKDVGNNKRAMVSGKQAGRLTESNERMEKLLTKLTTVYEILSKYRENAETMKLDTINEVNAREVEYKTTMAANSAFKSAMSILTGGAHKEIYDEAMEFIIEETGQKVGEIERFMDVSKNIMDKIDLQNAVYEDKGMAMLEAWEKEDSIVLGTNKTLLINKQGGLSVQDVGVPPEMFKTQIKDEQVQREKKKDTYKGLFDQ